jgi:hypothetical protein
VLFARPRSAYVSCGEATLRTHPSSGQTTVNSLLRHPRLSACHSGAALGRPDAIAPQWTTASLLAASFMVHCIERGFLGRGQNTHPAGPLLSFSFRERTGERMVTGSKA